MSGEVDRLLRLPQVIEIAGIGKTMIYRLIRQGDFPQTFEPWGYASRRSEAENTHMARVAEMSKQLVSIIWRSSPPITRS